MGIGGGLFYLSPDHLENLLAASKNTLVFGLKLWYWWNPEHNGIINEYIADKIAKVCFFYKPNIYDKLHIIIIQSLSFTQIPKGSYKINNSCYRFSNTAKIFWIDINEIEAKYHIRPYKFIQHPFESVNIPPNVFHSVVGLDEVNICISFNYMLTNKSTINRLLTIIEKEDEHNDKECQCSQWITCRKKGFGDRIAISLIKHKQTIINIGSKLGNDNTYDHIDVFPFCDDEKNNCSINSPPKQIRAPPKPPPPSDNPFSSNPSPSFFSQSQLEIKTPKSWQTQSIGLKFPPTTSSGHFPTRQYRFTCLRVSCCWPGSLHNDRAIACHSS